MKILHNVKNPIARLSPVKFIVFLLLIAVVGLYGFVIGTVGAMMTFLFTLDMVEKNLMHRTALHPEALAILVGAICGGLPFGSLAMRWVFCSFLNREQKGNQDGSNK